MEAEIIIFFFLLQGVGAPGRICCITYADASNFGLISAFHNCLIRKRDAMEIDISEIHMHIRSNVKWKKKKKGNSIEADQG